MPMNRSAYPANWEAVSAYVRIERALHRCECTGECGQHKGHRCNEVNHQQARWFIGRVILTAAHMCACYPLCANASHLRAMCQKCHLRTDSARHAAARLRTMSTPQWTPKRRATGKPASSGGVLPELRRLPKRKRTRLWFPAE